MLKKIHITGGYGKILGMVCWYAAFVGMVLLYVWYADLSWWISIPLAAFTPLCLFLIIFFPYLVIRSTVLRAVCPVCNKRGLSIGKVMLLEATPLNEHRDDFYENARNEGYDTGEKKIRVKVSSCKFCAKQIHQYKDGGFDVIDLSDPEYVHQAEPENILGSNKSRGGLYLAAGFLFLNLGCLAASMPGGYWPIFMISFAFNLVGLVVARGWVRRLIAVVLSGLSGGLFLQDFLIWMGQR